jgi:hypothetical protein
MSHETFLRARLEIELRQAHEELSRLEAERLRLARKNELLCATLYELRSEHVFPEPLLRKIEQALSFDGQPWSDFSPDADSDADADPDSDADSDSDAERYDDDEESGTVPI